MQKKVWISDDWNDKKARVTPALNRILKDVGVTFSVEPPKGKIPHRQLVVTIDEEVLDKATKKPTGRPVTCEFDYNKVMELKKKGRTNQQIADELGISISLYYLRMREYKNNNCSIQK